jgi:seryl-tRNA synthetase
MLDLNYIRENQGEVISRLHYRLESPTLIKLLLMADARHRNGLQALEKAQQRRNAISGEIGQLMRDKAAMEIVEALKAEMVTVKADIEKLTPQVEEDHRVVMHHLSRLPNLPMKGVPLGPDADHNIEIRREGVKPSFSFTPKEHFDLGEPLGMDFETGAKVSGARFVFLKGKMARLERALGQFMLDFHTENNGYTEVAPPLLVREESMFGTGQLPKFEEDLFKTTDGRYLIPTAEVSLTNMVRDSVLHWGELGRYCALTPCFRAEAGSAGRDTRGMIRQHQFNKVELVSLVSEEVALHEMEHERMLGSVEHMLKALGLHYRVMLLSVGDMGFSASKTYDIEVWLPGQNAFREISSISYCGDFQARRMNARYRPAGETKGTKFIHTFNGSGVAVGRALVAILETYQREDGSILIPEALRPYMNSPTANRDDRWLIGGDEAAERNAFIERLNAKLEAAGIEERVELNPPEAKAIYAIDGPNMCGGYSDEGRLEDFVDGLVEIFKKKKL